MHEQLVARVNTWSAKDERGVATACVVAPRRLLTAAHALYDDRGAPHVRIGVSLGADQPPHDARILWSGRDEEPPLDVAVLGVDAAIGDGHDPAALVSGRLPAAGELWQSWGYPREVEDRGGAPRRLVPLKGTTYASAEGACHLELGADDPAEAWGGVSGAPVFIGRAVVGIIVERPDGYQNRRLFATPIGRMLARPGFREAVGLPGERDRALHTLVADLAARIERHPPLRDALAAAAGCAYDAGAVATCLAGSPVKAAVDLLDQASGTLQDSGRLPRGVAHEILSVLLPVAFDWDKVGAARDAILAGAPYAEVPLTTRSAAEVVMAGAESRPCRWVRVGGDAAPVGAGLLGTQREPGIDRDGRRLARWLLELVAVQAGCDSKAPPDVIRTRALALLRRRADPKNRRRMALYFLVRDPEDPSGDLREHARTLADALPGLRLLALSGDPGADAAIDETELMLEVGDILRRDPEPETVKP